MTHASITLPGGFVTTRDAVRDEILLFESLRSLRQQAHIITFDPVLVEKQKRAFVHDNAQKTDMQLAEQARVVFDDMTRPAPVMLLTGPPGAAKSTVAALWAGLARAAVPNIPIMVMTQEKPALHRLTEKLGIKDAVSVTLDAALDSHMTWPQDGIIIIDEAGLLGTRALARLLARAVTARARHVVLIGDDKQLLPQDVGHPFRWIRENNYAHVVELHVPFRQREPHLRHAVDAIYRGDIHAALAGLDVGFYSNTDIVDAVKHALDGTAPDKTLGIINGPDNLAGRLRGRCAGYRFYSMAAAQGLAVDHVVLVLGTAVNMAEFLVGCSRQRFSLRIFIDNGLYKDKDDMAARIASFPRKPMALDHESMDTLIKYNSQD